MSSSPPGSPRAGSPRAGSASPPAAPPPATPGRRPGANEALSPNPPMSPPSGSPVFGRTPRSGGSPLQVLSPSAPLGTPQQRARFGSPPPAFGSPLAGGSPNAASPNGASPNGRPARTPVRVGHRGFLGSPPAMSSPLASVDVDLDADDAVEEGNFLYGTDINEMNIVRLFHRFLKRFKPHGASEGDRPVYMLQLDQKWEEQQQKDKGIKFSISGSHINEFSPQLYSHLVGFPTEVIPIFDRELWNISVRHLALEPEELGTCQVKVHDLLESNLKIMRDLNPCDIERLISIKGIIIRCSDIVPDMLSGTFRCTNEDCKFETTAQLNHWTIEEPTRCESCNRQHSFEIVHNECAFSDRQMLKLQETPESIPEGETPQNVVVYAYDDLVDTVRPGDRVEITGIYRAAANRPIAGWRQLSSVYRTYIDAVAIAAEQKGKIDAPIEEELNNADRPKLADEPDLDPEKFQEAEIDAHKQIRALGQELGEDGKRTIYNKLVNSFAPSIFEEDEVKRGLLCQLFGGTRKTHEGSKGRCRPEINTLLCGDPSTAKSQLMQYAYKLASRGVFTSGKGSSAVGLTATISRDPVSKDLVLESGALVLSDRGVCCIDEFDKMDESARAILHEAMEQQTVSIAKGGIVCSLNARCAVLASANPKDSSYDPRKSVVDNINLPKNLMTRFDFIWLMLDKRNRDTDRRLAEHLVAMYSVGGKKAKPQGAISADMFRKYISFAKRWVHPELTDEAAASLIKHYTDLRNLGGNRDVITATPRVLESLIRIAESIAKMELREQVTVVDVDEAVRLVKAATYASAVDPETGLIDMEQLIAGVGAGRRRRAKELESLLQEVIALLGSKNAMVTTESVRASMNEMLGARKEQLMNQSEYDQALRQVESDGLVVRRGKQLEVRSA